MPQICLYFQLHQPYRLDEFNVFDLGKKQAYFSRANKQNQAGNIQVFQKVAQKSYLPMLRLLNEVADEFDQFVFALSASGIFLEQAEKLEPEIIELIKRLLDKGSLELLSETYYHSLSFLKSEREFIDQIRFHSQKIEKIFNVKPAVFRNTELIHSNDLVELLLDSKLEFKGILTEAVDRYLDGQKRTQLFRTPEKNHQTVPLLLKHAQLSDDIAFRFSNPSWQWHPLTVDRYLDWVEIYPENEIVNLFMDFETFGEHQWEDTGIFDFFHHFVKQFLTKDWNKFVMPSQIFDEVATSSEEEKKTATKLEKLPVYDVPDYISWADIDRDLTAWVGNQLQADALRKLFDLEEKVLASKDQQIIEDWRKLQTSDHFYYMCTKWSADGDVHAYFSPYDSPLEAYRRYSIVLADLEERLL
ncbi:MAG: glycoside hydrolase family 57 protein [Patescibacteria group bacterium]|nr:glycoside hydrolase family 57 protein [Patescibacteria group bacterium]